MAQPHMTRRQALLTALFGSGYVGLRSLATGIPVSILLNPRLGLAADAPAPDPTAQFLVQSSSFFGDPLNGNVPGTYDDPGIVHPTDPRMASANVVLAGKSVKGAAAWNGLGQPLLDQTVFFHHATYTVGHGDMGKIQGLFGAVTPNDMLISALAVQTAPRLGTVQTPPMSIGGAPFGGNEAITAEGRTQPELTPSSLASTLVVPKGPLSNLQPLRDKTLDALNAFYKSEGNAGQKNFLDRYATSQTQLRQTAGSVLQRLSSVTDDGPAAQMTAVVAIIQMKLAPVVTVHLPWGGDNHGDTNLQGEANDHVNSIQNIAQLYQDLGNIAAPSGSGTLADQTSFMAMNVFGRTMAVSHEGTNGRDHNPNHHATVLIGKNFTGGVVGGVAPMGIGTEPDYGAQPFDAATGKASAGGNVDFNDTFAAMGKTLGQAVGVDAATMATMVSGGAPVQAVLKNSA